MRRIFVFMFLAIGLSCCDVIKPEPTITITKTPSSITNEPEPDPGKQDYWPLAVGNTWRFVINETTTNTTPNGSSTSTSSSSETWRVSSFQKETNERYRFMILVNDGKNIGDTINIVRDSTTFSIYPTIRTGVADTISTFISVYPFTPIERTWVKGVGVIKDTWSRYIHITAGNQYHISGSRALVGFTVKQ